MLVTLKELACRIETVRRGLGDSSGLAVVRLRVNGVWIEVDHESFVIDDGGAILIDSKVIEVSDTECCAAGVAAMLPHAEQLEYLRRHVAG